MRSTGRWVACARHDQIFGRALEGRRIGQHRKAGGAAALIGARELLGIEIGADDALARARLLDLGDQARLLPFPRGFEGGAKSARGRGLARFRHQAAQGPFGLRRRHLFALIGCNRVEDRHRSFRCRRASSSAAAARPLSIASAAARDAILQIRSLARDDQGGGRIQEHDVAKRVPGAREQLADRARVLLRRAALQRRERRALDAGVFGHDVLYRDAPVFEHGDTRGSGGRHFVEPIRAVHDPRFLGSEIGQHMGDRFEPFARVDADQLATHARRDCRSDRAD